MAQVKKVSAGIYDLSVDGRQFEIERVEDGTWQLVERLPHGTPDYWNHFATKGAAVAAAASQVAA